MKNNIIEFIKIMVADDIISQEVAEKYCPEIKESKDESIRKALIDYFRWNPNGQLLNEFSNKEVFAWLEKQDEQKPYGQRQECTDCQFNYAGECKGSCVMKRDEQKPTVWSEDDEKFFESSLWHIKNSICNGKGIDVQCELTEWFKSLKDRVQPQNIIVTDEELAQAKKDAYNDALDKIEYHSGEPTFDDGWSAAIWYLKKRNAQPQTTWKPSDEQMKALLSKLPVIKGSGDNVQDILESLYQDLKKLREE